MKSFKKKYWSWKSPLGNQTLYYLNTSKDRYLLHLLFAVLYAYISLWWLSDTRSSIAFSLAAYRLYIYKNQ